MRIFLAHALIVLAAWTIVIKYLFPIAWAIAEHAPLTRYVWWDFWWVVHLVLARALIVRSRHLFRLALAVAIAEVGIVAVKLALFLDTPEWTIWTTNWFVNKIFVIGLFGAMLAHIAAAPQEYHAGRDRSPVGPAP